MVKEPEIEKHSKKRNYFKLDNKKAGDKKISKEKRKVKNRYRFILKQRIFGFKSIQKYTIYKSTKNREHA